MPLFVLGFFHSLKCLFPLQLGDLSCFDLNFLPMLSPSGSCITKTKKLMKQNLLSFFYFHFFIMWVLWSCCILLKYRHEQNLYVPSQTLSCLRLWGLCLPTLVFDCLILVSNVRGDWRLVHHKGLNTTCES